MDLELKDQVVWITGGASGIGKACGRLFAREGARVALTDLESERLRTAVSELSGLPGPVEAFAADITNAGVVRAVVQALVARWGRLDALVNSAGIYRELPADQIPLEQWNQVLLVNLGGTFLCCQAALEIMKARGRGSIVNLSSVAGEVGGIVAGADYAASKAGVICLTKSLAKAAGRYGVRVNTICPGIIDTPMTAPWPADRKEDLAHKTPLGRLGTPEEVAGVALFLCSRLASFVHGARLDVNGGIYMS
ncbi:MAG: SDR family oxidoreductase [Planctomycetes bacterium]|nr:SDR family oxidoreductase [Planctomycetota bacterium]